jgi:N-acetylmuramate 1-kinase
MLAPYNRRESNLILNGRTTDGEVPDTNARAQALRHWVTTQLTAREPAAELRAWAPLRGDASFRRFYRAWLDGDGTGSLIAMDAPPATENNRQFVALSALFRRHGVRVPAVLASDFEQGFLLVEDLGDRLFASVYDTPQRDAALEAALQALIRIQSIGDANGLVPPYTIERFHDELELFTQWLADRLLGLPPRTAVRGLLDRSWQVLIENTQAQPQCCVHRDYHSRNLLLLPTGEAAAVDFQDALWGPLSYDVASLLRDCYVRFDDAEIARWQQRYLLLAADAGIADYDAATFARHFDRMAIQRQLKAAGIFARLHLRDAKNHYLPVIPGVLEQVIEMAARDPALAPLADWLATAVQPAARSRIAALTGTVEARP